MSSNYVTYTILRALARRISCKKRSFGFHPQDDIALHRCISPIRHCDERSEEAIQENNIQNKFANCNAGKILNQVQDDKYFGLRCKDDRKKSKRKGNVISWIASLLLAMTQNVIPTGKAVILRGVNPEESHVKRDPSDFILRMTVF